MKIFPLLAVAVLLVAAGQSPAQTYRITNPENTANGNFGASLAFVGGYLCVGAPNAVQAGIAGGAVFVFNAASGAYVGKIYRAGTVQDDRFGTALAVSGNRLTIGSPGSDANAGRVYQATLPVVGTVATNTWRNAPDASSNSGFGASVAANGVALAVGAPDAQLSGGRAYSGSDPLGPGAFTAFGPRPAGSLFGSAVALVGNTLLIGAKNFDGSGVQSGGVFRANGSLILPPGIGGFSQFGASLAAFGGLAVVGAPDEDNATPSTNVGAVYLIDPASGGVAARYQPPAFGNSGRLGTSVAASGAFVFAGAPYATGPASGELESGAFVFIDRTLPFYDPLPLAPAGIVFQDRFGDAIAAAPGWVAIGAPEAHVNGVPDSGAVYVYRTDAPLPTVKPKPKKIVLAASARTALLKGRATAGFGGIARVEYTLKRTAAYRPLKGTLSWRGKAKLKGNPKKIFVRALDTAGRPSAVATIRLTRRPAP